MIGQRDSFAGHGRHCPVFEGSARAMGRVTGFRQQRAAVAHEAARSFVKSHGGQVTCA